jgi:hypothetical protein
MAFDPSMLSHFTGTEHYYRLNRRCLITDVGKYLADEAGAYWLLDVAASYLLELGTSDWFVLVRLRYPLLDFCFEDLTAVRCGNNLNWFSDTKPN